MSEEASTNQSSSTTSNGTNLFVNIKYKATGNVSDEVFNLLKEGGAEGSNYFSDHLTHCIVGDDPIDTDIADAKDLYEIPAVTVDWVILSKKCGKLLPIKPFIAAEPHLFAGISVCVSQVSKEDSTMLWAMITFYGGTFTLKLNSKTTHLIAGKAEGVKYSHVMSQEKCSIHIVTPDWVTTCINQKTKVDETNFHPRLIVIPQLERRVSELSSSFSTAHITGFADDEAKDEQLTPKLSNELLEQLKQRMPWNLQSTASNTIMPATSQNFITSTMSGSVEVKDEIKLPITPTATMQQSLQSLNQNLVSLSKPTTIIQHSTVQQKAQIILQQQQQQQQQRLQQPMQATPQWRAQSPLQQTQQQLIHQQLQAHQQQQQQQQGLGQQTMLLSPQNQHEGQQFITSQTQQLINRGQQIVHQQPKPVQQQQFIVREAPPHLVQPQYTENKPQAQFTWQQQPQYAQNRQQIISPQGQPRQITWMQQSQAQGATRQFIQMDAQTHAQLQQMDPQERSIFLQRVQKQRQLVLQRQLQAQQQNRAVLEQNQVQFGVRSNQPQGAQRQQQTAVIRGQMPPGLNPQHQLQWLQQQRHNQIVIQQNNRPVLVQQQAQPSAGIIRAPPLQTVHQRLPVNVVSQPTQQQQWQQENNLNSVPPQPVTPTQQQQLMNMRQQQLQIQRIQQLQLQKQQHQPPTPSPRMPLYTTQATIPPPAAPTPQPSVLIPQHQEPPDPGSGGELFGVNGQQQNQQGLVVNAKTKTALANMLSIRLQTGSTTADGTAAGQLRMMGAQHQAPLPPPPPPQVAQLPFQRTTLGSVNNNIGMRPEIVPSSGISKPAFAQTALRVAAVLQKSASGTPPTNHHHRPQFYGHSPNLKLPSDMFLLGCVFLIMEYDRSGFDVTMWRRIILENGGETELTYSLRVTHILCQTQKHPLVQQGIRDGKRCVTAEWLSDIMIKQQVLPPWLALHFPTPFSDEKPCRNLIISHSGFEGEERTRVKKMIEAVGAKMTSYYTSHNNILVCKRPEGDKYKKAREWGRSVVNVQWLNEVLFGHYSCLQHPENPKYQQFNIANPFRIDYTLVPHLMGAWKVPIQVTQECYDRAKASGIVGPKRKRPRVASPTNMGGIEQENMFPIESTLPPIGMPKAVVMFSGPTTTPSDGEKKVLHLGGIISKNCREATHLVVYKLQRTLKLMCALSVCKYIVNINWLNDSFNSNQFLDEQPYLIDDPEFEKKHNCNIMKILSNPERCRLFVGKIFYITPGVVPSRSALSEMVVCAGGVIEKQRKSLKQIQELESNTYIIITVSNDFHLVSDVIRANIGIYSAEFIMSAILTQRLPYETAFRRNNAKKSL